MFDLHRRDINDLLLIVRDGSGEELVEMLEGPHPPFLR